MAIEISQLGTVLPKLGKQIRFAGIVALTRVAILSQKEVRKELKEKFELRNKRTSSGIRVTQAKKGLGDPFSEVYSKDWYIAEHETGKKRSARKKSLKAHDIPIHLFKASDQPMDKKIKKKYSANFIIKQIGRGRKPAKIGDHRPFVATMKSGFTGIFVRLQSSNLPIEPVYQLKKEVITIKKRAFFFKTIDKTYSNNIEKVYRDAITDAFKTIRT